MHDGNRRWWALGAMCFALFMIMLDNTVVNVALPSIQRSLDASTSSLEWTVNAYTLSFAVLLVTGGRLGDLFGRRKVFLAGVVIFASASAAIGFSPSDTWLVAWRAVQGVGSALMMPATLSIITNAFPPQERGKAIGTWAGVSAMALAIGPVVGGFLVESVSWQSIFFLNVPVAVGAVVISLFAVRESRDETVTRSVDIPGVATLTIGLAALVLALVEGNEWGWASPRELAMFAVAAVGLLAFALVERRRSSPMVDFNFFRSRTFLGANIVAFIVSFAMLAMFFFLALYMQNIRGYSPLGAGLRFLPSTVMILSMNRMVGGTFGVAILGALVATLGRAKIDELLPQLPDAARAKLTAGLGSGGVAQGVPARVIDGTQQAFVYALHYGLLLGSGVALLGAIAALALIRKRSDELVEAQAGDVESLTPSATGVTAPGAATRVPLDGEREPAAEPREPETVNV